MKKYTCFLVEGIITSSSSRTNQCAIVIMVAILKANLKKGRVVTDAAEELTLGIQGQLPFCWAQKWRRQSYSAETWGSGRKKHHSEKGTKWGTGQKQKASLRSKVRPCPLQSFPQYAKGPAPCTFENSRILQVFSSIFYYCVQILDSH